MTAPWIILGIALFLLLVLLFPIRVILTYDENVSVVLSLLGIRIPLFPRKHRKSKHRRKGARTKKHLEASKKDKDASIKKKSDRLSTLKLFLRVLKRIQKKLRGSFTVRIKRMYASIATEDAAKTAILYGVVTQAFSYALAASEEFLKMKYRERDIVIITNYLESESHFDVKIVFASNPFLLIRIALKALFAVYLTNSTPKNDITEEHKDG